MSRSPPPEGKRFKKGQSGNPLGAAAHNPALKAIRKLTLDQIEEMGSMILEGDLNALEAIVKDRSQSTLRVMIASVVITAIKKGDANALATIIEQIIGKRAVGIDLKATSNVMVKKVFRVEWGSRNEPTDEIAVPDDESGI